jgi:hypothetical protein
LLIALWVRSIYWIDFMSGPGFGNGAYIISAGTNPGSIGVGIIRTDQYAKPWMAQSERRLETTVGNRGIWGKFTLGRRGVGAPFWFVALLAATSACTPWLRWRFSLRTLLIAMTLVAMGLGLVVYALRN